MNDDSFWLTVKVLGYVAVVLALCAVALALWSVRAPAGEALPAAGSTLRYLPPPAYAARSLEGHPVQVRRAPVDRLPALCRLEPGGLVGCAIVHPVFCEIIIADHLPKDLARQVLEHEKAHCLGWRHPE